MSSLSRSKQLCTFVFSSVIPNDTSTNGEWLCIKCGQKKLKSGGWTNLLNHIRSCVGTKFAEQFDSVQLNNKSRITAYVLHVSNAVHDDVFEWINFTYQYGRWSSYKRGNLLQVDWFKVTAQTHCQCAMLWKRVSSVSFPTNFAIVVFHGSTEGTTHYIGVSAF